MERVTYRDLHAATVGGPIAAAALAGRLENDDVTEEGVLRVPFSLRGLDGQVDVAMSANSEPDALGYSLLTGGGPAGFARGFPVCRAIVRYPADGYAAIFGWTQLVRSADGATAGFEMDPIAVYAGIPTPFAWFGLRPELFDAPSREGDDDLDWEAHSFLCALPDAVLSRTVQAVTGFRWGFARRGGHFTFAGPAILEEQAWNGHLALLRSEYPGWEFEPGFAS